jgi:hypothetical protein
MSLVQCPACSHEVSDVAAACPNCGHPMRPVRTGPEDIIVVQQQQQARIKQVHSTAGGGCGLQGLGVVSIILAVVTFYTVIGFIVFGILGLWLLLYGSRKARWFECSNCGGKIVNKRIKICFYCNFKFN